MVNTPLLLFVLFAGLWPAEKPLPALENEERNPAAELYADLCLEEHMSETVFEAGYRSVVRHRVKARMLAIADMSQPSTAERFYLIDLENKELVLRTWVAHGQGNGELMATRFSNKEGSHQTSLGLYRVGQEILSPKHGAALLLHGLDRGVNCQALKREVIMHSADYVSAEFIAEHGRLGRSWGCPALSREVMPQVIDLLADGGYLYVHGR